MLICDISILNRMGKSMLDEHLKPMGFIWREMVVLMVLEQVPGASQNFIGSFLQTDKSNVTKLLKDMEKKNLIERRIKEEDRRVKGLYLTNSSKELLPPLHHVMIEWENICYTALNKEEIEMYRQLNQKVIGHLLQSTAHEFKGSSHDS